MSSHYEVLGIREDASSREINAAYRRLAKKHHPDKGGDPGKFQKVTEAYNVLKNRSEREAYDFEHKFENFLDETSGRRTLLQRLADILRARAFSALSGVSFLLGVLLIDAGDGINEDYNPVLLASGAVSILLCVGFFANRGEQYSGMAEALMRAVFSIVFFLFDVLMRVYVILVLIFSVVVLVALLNWVKKNYLHLLPLHF